MEQEPKQEIMMVDRAMQVLQYLSECEGGAGISAIANALTLPKATVFRILNTLMKWKVVESNFAGEGYQLGFMLIKLGQKATSKVHLVDVCKPIMNEIAHQVDESINLGVLCENSILSIYAVGGENSMLSSKQMPISPLYCSSMGKAHLAYFEQDALQAYFKRSDVVRRTKNSILTWEEFQKEQDEIKANQLAFDNEEYEIGLYCIATPLRNAQGKVLASMSVSGPVNRMLMKKDKIIQQLQEAKSQIEIYAAAMQSFAQ